MIGDYDEELSSPTMKTKLKKKKRNSLSGLTKAQSKRDGHSPVNEKPLYLELSVPPTVSTIDFLPSSYSF